MALNRLEALRAMLAQDPSNALARYGVALELANSGQLAESVEEFRALLEANPNYAAGYFHAGQTLEKLSRVDDARAMYERGIEVTTRSGDGHTRSELQAALDLLPI